MPFASIPDAAADIREGRMIIIVDDEDRENEGDLVCAAEKITPEIINFMARHARGLICLPLTEERCDELHLSPQVADNTSRLGHRVHGLDRSAPRSDHRNLSRRSRDHDSNRRRSAHQAAGSRAARSHLSVAREEWRRAGSSRTDRSGG